MVRTIAALPIEQRPHVFIHHAIQTIDDEIYAADWQNIDPSAIWLRSWRYISTEGEHVSTAVIIERSGMGSYFHWYISGSATFVGDLQSNLSRHNIPQEQIHVEKRA